MPNEIDIGALLNRVEDETLDLKATGYDLSSDDGRFALVKDVICMANTPRTESSYIVCGVKKHPDGRYDLWGITNHPDEALLQSQFTERVYPIPSFRYFPLRFQNVELGILEIPPVRRGPSAAIRDFGSTLRQWQIYFRRGSKNDVATPSDQLTIAKWFSDDQPVPVAKLGTPWEELLQHTFSYSSQVAHVFVVSPNVAQAPSFGAVGRLPWSAVIDFDPQSDRTGALAIVRPHLTAHRSLHLVTLKDTPGSQGTSSTYWMFVRGLDGRSDTLSLGPWNAWLRASGGALSAHLRRLASLLAPQPVVFTVIWRDPALLAHLQTLLESSLSAFGSALSVVFVTEDPAELHPLAAKIGAEIVSGPLPQLFAGLDTLGSALAADDPRDITLPSSSGAPLKLPRDLALWIQEELDIVHLGCGQTPSPDRQIGTEFLRGAEIDWFDLGMHSDVERDLLPKVTRQVSNDLRDRRTARVNLFHAPGAGGTTLGRRLLWNFHSSLPVAIVRRVTTLDTAERVFRISSLTGLPVVLLLDGAEISERQLDEFSDNLRARHIPAVLLQVLRRFSPQVQRDRSFYLQSELSAAEAERFAATYARENSDRRQALLDLARQAAARYRSAFYFGLVAFGTDFRGLTPYVRSRLEGLTAIQQKVVGFIAIAHRYAQRPVPIQAFAELLGLPPERPLAFTSVLPPATLELVIQQEPGLWRTAHELIASEVLEQLLTPPSGDRRTWKQQLSSWGRDFALFCRGSSATPSEALLEIARRVFIYRDNSELIGTERSGSDLFSQFVHDIPSDEGALETLRLLTELYPDEAHFWAHLGRFHSVVRSDWAAALDCIARALALDERDSVLHHMKGMALRAQVYDVIASKGELASAIGLAREASEAFRSARLLNPDNEHAYISEVQLLTRLLDYAGRQHESGVWGYLASPTADPWLRESLQRAEELLERIRRNREGQGDSTYEADCRARLDALYGRYDRALQVWDNLLSRAGVYAPPVRRQIVWTYLARRDRSWDRLEPREVDRIVELLEQNLRDEPDSDTNLRLWVQAVRRASSPPTLDSVIERVSYWRANADSLEATFYLYLLYAVQCIEGSTVARDLAARFIEESRTRARLRRNRTKSFEWFGSGSGLRALVHQSQLGEWCHDKEFWENTGQLARLTGRISRLDGPQAGEIELVSGLRAFFVPARGGFSRGQSENRPVSFFLGFSYDGLRAWEVEPLGG